MRPRRRPLTKTLICPTDGRTLGQTDGRRVYLDGPVVLAVTRQRVTLGCTRPGCGGHVTWYPAASRAVTEGEGDDQPGAAGLPDLWR